jgi:hypothetical protein
MLTGRVTWTRVVPPRATYSVSLGCTCCMMAVSPAAHTVDTSIMEAECMIAYAAIQDFIMDTRGDDRAKGKGI